jgi:heme/copper-type cytochrome/quinol oxidase subunit 2
MPIVVEAKSPEDYAAWLASKKAPAAAPAAAATTAAPAANAG